MKHTPEAIEVAKGSPESHTSWDINKVAVEREWGGVGILPVSITRDSDSVESSNWDALLLEIEVKVGRDQADYFEFTHWAVGWVRLGIYNSGNKALAKIITQARKDLDSYPILDENLFSIYEWKSNHPVGDQNCYSNSECECGRISV
jgi:hypothetical protein